MPKIIDDHEVFTAALNLFVTRGYEGATTKEIALAAGIHEASLFRKYGSKADLLVQAVNHGFATSPLSNLTYSGDLTGDLIQIVQAYLAVNKSHGAIIPVLFSEVPRHPALADALDALLANIHGIVRIIEQYQTQGLLKAEPPLASTSALIGPLMAVHMFPRITSDLPATEIAPQQYVQAFLHGRKR